MRRFVEEADRGQWTLLPECLDDFIDEGNPVRVVDAFVDALDLAEMSFKGVEPAATGRPSYHPSVLLKLYIYGWRSPMPLDYPARLGRLCVARSPRAHLRSINGQMPGQPLSGNTFAVYDDKLFIHVLDSVRPTWMVQ